MPVIELFVPGEVKGLARPRMSTFHGHARAYDPSSNVNEKGRLQVFLKDAIAKQELWGSLESDPKGYSLHVTAFFRCPKSMSKRTKLAAVSGQVLVKKKPDGDNILKMVCDAWNGILWDDDSEVTKMTVEKRYAEGDGMVITVRWEEPQ